MIDDTYEESGIMRNKDQENKKKQKLESILKGYGRVAVAFSGGVDSTFLLKTAHNVLGGQAVAVTVRSVFVPEKEQEEAERFCSELGIRLISIDADVLQIEGLAENPPNRCYICKKELFTRIREQAGQLQIEHIAEGDPRRAGLFGLVSLGLLQRRQPVGGGRLAECYHSCLGRSLLLVEVLRGSCHHDTAESEERKSS